MNETERFSQGRPVVRRAGRLEAQTSVQARAGHNGATHPAIASPSGETKVAATGSRTAAAAKPVDIHEQIRLRAYERYIERQGQPGCSETDWLEAEREVRSAAWAGKNLTL